MIQDLENMFNNDFMPQEYKGVVSNLLDNFNLQAIEAYAKALGIESDYKKSINSKDDFKIVLQHFLHNTSLLITKTWSDKNDEIRKEKLNIRIKKFVAKIEEEKDYNEALKYFDIILDELAFLFFGVQSKKPDFIEYAFRIDMQLGLFFCYGKHISEFADKSSPEVLHAFLLLGICYLAAL